jgi:uroporphyrin-III C-methyltransferase/precorrin-2 dehydrogenase/sirohydrochlorin ferrochelatase
VAADAAQRGVLVNVVDEPQHCTFVMPSIVDRSPLLVAISTAGAAPVLARMVRGEIEALLPPGLGALSDLLSRQRRAIKEALPDLTDRRRFMEAMLAGPVAEMAQVADSTLAEAELLRRLAAFTSEEARLLTVVGTGPGDPDLLTFQAQRFMQQADHVFHESDVSDAILERCRRDAPRTELPIGGQVDLAKRAASAGRAALLVVGDGQRQARALMNTPGSDAFVIRHVRGLPTGDAAT